MSNRSIMKAMAVVALILSMAFPSPVNAESTIPPQNSGTTPQIPLDCGVNANVPYKSGSTVYGVGSISCLTSHSSLRIVVQVIDSTGRSGISNDVTCYNTNICSASASLSYISGRTWKTAASGYYAGQNIYYESSFVSL